LVLLAYTQNIAESAICTVIALIDELKMQNQKAKAQSGMINVDFVKYLRTALLKLLRSWQGEMISRNAILNGAFAACL